MGVLPSELTAQGSIVAIANVPCILRLCGEHTDLIGNLLARSMIDRSFVSCAQLGETLETCSVVSLCDQVLVQPQNR